MQPENTPEAAEAFGTAILTTDIVTKSCGYETIIDGKTVKMGGAAKGSGMIHPNMATMLGFITTDAVIEPDDLQQALSSITNDTFNQITVDGDCSTNDMVLVLANGEANNEPLTPDHPEWSIFPIIKTNFRKSRQTNCERRRRCHKTDRSECSWHAYEARFTDDGEDDRWVKSSENGSFWSGCKLGTNHCCDGKKRSGIQSGSNNDRFW